MHHLRTVILAAAKDESRSSTRTTAPSAGQPLCPSSYTPTPPYEHPAGDLHLGSVEQLTHRLSVSQRAFRVSQAVGMIIGHVGFGALSLPGGLIVPEVRHTDAEEPAVADDSTSNPSASG